MSPDAQLVVRATVTGGALAELALPASLLRAPHDGVAQVVSLYVPSQPTVAFSSRDVRSPRFEDARRAAEDAGFVAAVRAPGGRMVAYDEGAVVIDHLTYTTAGSSTGRPHTFAENAADHLRVIRALGGTKAQIGELDGEYCPGEFSINMDRRVKVLGSAQRVAGGNALFSTVVQVDLSQRVRAVIAEVSSVLGYPLAPQTVGGLRDYLPTLEPEHVASAFADEYLRRLGAAPGRLPEALVQHAQQAVADQARQTDVFRAAEWGRSNPAPVAPQ
jgi:octanoyl-[GcvH]:protein N-octanoyltransferase